MASAIDSERGHASVRQLGRPREMDYWQRGAAGLRGADPRGAAGAPIRRQPPSGEMLQIRNTSTSSLGVRLSRRSPFRQVVDEARARGLFGVSRRGNRRGTADPWTTTRADSARRSRRPPETAFVSRTSIIHRCVRFSSKTTRRSPTSSRAVCARPDSPSIAPRTATPALERRRQQPYDVAIVDVMLPKRDGLSVIDEMRRRGIATPVLILSARRSVDDRVRGLQAGGDDYLTKPFAFAELLARVQALVRRRDPDARADDADRRGPVARPAVAPRDARRQVDRPAAARVRAARIPDAERRPGRLEDDDSVARLGIQLRSANQHRRRAGEPPAREDRSPVRHEAAAHGARRRLCSPVSRRGVRPRSSACAWRCGTRRCLSSAPIPIVFLTYWLTSTSLAQRDQQILQQQTRRLRGGVPSRRPGRARRHGPGRTAARRPSASSFASSIEGSMRSCSASRKAGSRRRWRRRRSQLWDGTLVQVGKSTEAAKRSAGPISRGAGVVTLSIVLIALTGGCHRHAIRAVADPTTDAAVSRIIRTGRTDERVPLAGSRPPTRSTNSRRSSTPCSTRLKGW